MSIDLRSAGSWTLGLLCLASPVAGQDMALRAPFETAVVASPQTSPNTYGTTSDVVYTVWASEFQIVTNGVNAEGTQDGNTGGRRCATGSCIFLGAAHLPNGAAIKSIELEACDNSATSGVAYALFRAVSPGQTVEALSIPTETGAAETPGCALFPTPTIPHTVDNATGAYVPDIVIGADPNVSFSAVRIRYNLQVSAGPVTPTFNDVPTGHPQYQFIEALVAAGITAGCGAGNYCPDATLTRGQMAVFLSKALGLHFPN